MQSPWHAGLQWDNALPKHYLDQWVNLTYGLEDLADSTISDDGVVLRVTLKLRRYTDLQMHQRGSMQRWCTLELLTVKVT